jgi:HK97 family phage portal protein
MSRVGPLIAFDTHRQPVWAPRDYATFAREGYMQNAVVYRCVRMIAEAAASIPLLVYDGDSELEDHPLRTLIRRPNPVSTGTDLMESWYGHLLVSGNAYLEAVALDGELRELHALRPDRMKVIPGPEGWPEAYEYSVAGRTALLDGEPVEGVRRVLHMKLFHPANDHYGMSPIEAAATAIDIHNTAAKWNKALLDNSARPSGALVYSARDGNLTPEQYERLKHELETNFQGAQAAGRPLLLEGGLDWKSMSLSPKDMDFMEAKNAAAREIALAIGVPPVLLGIPGDATYSNYQEANRAFWRQTVIPHAQRTANALSRWLAPAYQRDLTFAIDLDALEALSSERDALWSRLEKTSFLTNNEKRQAIGYGNASPERKYAPDQPRDDRGRWTDGEVSEEGVDTAIVPVPLGTEPDASTDSQEGTNDGDIQDISFRRQFPNATPAQLLRLDSAMSAARRETNRTRELDPTWRPPDSVSAPGNIEGTIGHFETVARAAEARLAEITRDALPGANPSWGVNRLRAELNERGFTLQGPARGNGLIFQNSETLEELRIMERPLRRFRTDGDSKYYFEYYYRYRRDQNQPWGTHVPVPDKP